MSRNLQIIGLLILVVGFLTSVVLFYPYPEEGQEQPAAQSEPAK